MDHANLMWSCGHCHHMNWFGIDEYCCRCHRRRDAYGVVAQPDQVHPPVHQGNDHKVEAKAIDPTSNGFLEDPAISLKPIDVDKATHSAAFQTYSNGPDSQFEDYLFSSNNPGGQDWVPSEKLLFSEAKGLLTYSLATGEPASAPRRRAYSPTRRAEVALVRKNRACSPCRRRKHACSHSLEDREALQGTNQTPATKGAGVLPRTASMQSSNSGKPVENPFKVSSVPPRVPSRRAEAPRKTGLAKTSAAPRSEERPVFLPVPPTLTFVSERKSKPASPRVSLVSKEKSSNHPHKAPDYSTVVAQRQIKETSRFTTGLTSGSYSTTAITTPSTSEPLSPQANDTGIGSHLATTPQQTCSSAAARLRIDNKSHETQASGTRFSTKYSKLPELDTTDVLEEFTWINEIYDEEDTILSPFSSNISTRSDLDRWDSSTDITGVSLATTPFTEDEEDCWTPL